jgi:hypothetical protein
MAGRPTVRTPEFAESLCEHIANGGSLIEWCEQEGTPGYSTITDWLRDDEEFSAKYTHAREAQGDYFADKVVTTADNCVADAVEIQKAKLQIDSYKWAAAKRKPKVYGDKSAVDLTSNGKTIDSLTDDERIARTAALLDQARERRAGQVIEQ